MVKIKKTSKIRPTVIENIARNKWNLVIQYSGGPRVPWAKSRGPEVAPPKQRLCSSSLFIHTRQAGSTTECPRGWGFFGTPCKIIFMFNFNSFYFYFSTYFNSIFSFIFIFLTTTLGHKQALTSPCEGVQLINEVETPGLQGLTADEAKMWFCDLKVSVFKMVLSCLKIFCFQDGSLVFQDEFLVLLFPMVLPNIPGECWWSQWTFFGSTLPGGRHSLLPSSAILFPKSQKWCWSTLAW